MNIIKDLQAVYQMVLGKDVYAILTQGTAEYYEDSLLHISSGKNHVSLNSLGDTLRPVNDNRHIRRKPLLLRSGQDVIGGPPPDEGIKRADAHEH